MAAYRQHEALQRAGLASSMWVRFRDSPDETVTAYAPPAPATRRLKRVARRLYLGAVRADAQPDSLFSDDRAEYGGDECASLPPHDVVNLHWSTGFVDQPALFRTLPAATPLVVTMHDMHAFTGGCHYTGTCTRFTDECGCCPRLGKSGLHDLSYAALARKRSSYNGRPTQKLCFVADSHWLGEQARQSTLLKGARVEVIHYGLDLAVFRPLSPIFGREALRIPLDRCVVGFAAADIANTRKGMAHLIEALRGMAQRPFILTWGQGDPAALREFDHLHLGELTNEALMAVAYNCTDFCVVPSLEEAFGQTALEAIACGRPVVAFRTGGLVDTVRHRSTGLLARCGDSRELREAMEELMTNTTLRHQLGAQGRQLAEAEFSYAYNAQRYSTLYEQLLLNRQ